MFYKLEIESLSKSVCLPWSDIYAVLQKSLVVPSFVTFKPFEKSFALTLSFILILYAFTYNLKTHIFLSHDYNSCSSFTRPWWNAYTTTNQCNTA